MPRGRAATAGRGLGTGHPPDRRRGGKRHRDPSAFGDLCTPPLSTPGNYGIREGAKRGGCPPFLPRQPGGGLGRCCGGEGQGEQLPTPPKLRYQRVGAEHAFRWGNGGREQGAAAGTRTRDIQPLGVRGTGAGDAPPTPEHPAPTRHGRRVLPPLPQFPHLHAGDMHSDHPLSSATAVNGSLFVTRLPAVSPSPPCPPPPAAFSFPAQSQAFMVPEAPVTPCRSLRLGGDSDTAPPTLGLEAPKAVT